MNNSRTRALQHGQLVCGWLLVAAATFSPLACGASTEVAPPTRSAETTVTKAGPARPTAATPVFEQESAAATQESAVNELAPKLAAVLVGAAWAPLLEHATLSGSTWPTWLLHNQVLHKDPTSGRYSATLTTAQAEQALSEFASSGPPLAHLSLPNQWQTTFVSALLAEREWMVCQRKQQIFAIACEHQTPLNERLAVTALISDLSLESLLPDGIPVRESGAVVWPLEVRVVSQTNGAAMAMAGVPLELGPVADDGQTSGTQATASTNGVSSPPLVSDARGIAHFDLPPFSTALEVSVAKQALLGPFADLTELPNLRVHTRPLDAARQTVVALSGSGTGPQRAVVATLVQELSLVYGKPLPSLADELARGIQTTATLGQAGNTVLPAELRSRIVESTRGAVDYVVLVAGETEFASQMGADRTWYQARAQAHVLELWSGKLVAHFDESATGSGFGDQAAEQAAQSAVVQRLRIRLQGLRASQ